MRYSKTLAGILAVLSLGVPVSAADPAADGQPIDVMIETVIAKRKAAEDATKAAKSAEAELKAAVEALNKRLTDLGLAGPVVPPVIPPGPVIPPAPVVPTPPADPLAAKLWVAYRADAGPDKALYMAKLIELMQQAQALSDDPTIATVGTLAGKVESASKTLVKGQLPTVRAALVPELAAAFPEDGPLTATVRAGAKAAFARFQTALTEASK